MTGFMWLYADCFACRKPFYSNPETVPSYQNQPICRRCIGVVNKRRKAKGMPPWPIPKDAYRPVEAA